MLPFLNQEYHVKEDFNKKWIEFQLKTCIFDSLPFEMDFTKPNDKGTSKVATRQFPLTMDPFVRIFQRGISGGILRVYRAWRRGDIMNQQKQVPQEQIHQRQEANDGAWCMVTEFVECPRMRDDPRCFLGSPKAKDSKSEFICVRKRVCWYFTILPLGGSSSSSSSSSSSTQQQQQQQQLDLDLCLNQKKEKLPVSLQVRTTSETSSTPLTAEAIPSDAIDTKRIEILTQHIQTPCSWELTSQTIQVFDNVVFTTKTDEK
jgi:hypothetical protein